jgi:hypothetical protein
MDVAQICNMALGAAGSRTKLASLSDRSREAEVCQLWYETTRRAVFSAMYWNELRHTVALAVVKERQDGDVWTPVSPPPGWRFAYALPSDHFRPRHLSDYTRFQIEGTTLLGNTENAVLTYTRDIVDVNQWGPLLQVLMAYALAYHICIPLTGDNRTFERVRVMASEAAAKAMEAAANADITDKIEPVPDFIAARNSVYNYIYQTGFGTYNVTDRYYYPIQGLVF